jgi:hypothetical protein
MNIATIAFLLGAAVASPASVNTDSHATAQTQATPGTPVHYDFDDDNVEGDLQRPDGELISSIPKADQKSLIEIRKNFIPEILKMVEDL